MSKPDSSIFVSDALATFLREQARGQSQSAVAETAEISDALLSRLLKGERQTRWLSLRAVLLALNVTARDLEAAGFPDIAQRLGEEPLVPSGRALLAAVPLRPTTRALLGRLIDDLAKQYAPAIAPTAMRRRIDEAWAYATNIPAAYEEPFNRTSWERRVYERLVDKLCEGAGNAAQPKPG